MTTIYRIFVCATYRDLSQERAAVLEAIRKLQQQHDSMEYFGARSKQPIQTCEDEVAKSDIMVVIVGYMYGSIVPERGISFTEAEYSLARKLNKTCLVYFRDEAVPVLRAHVEKDPSKIGLLDAFKQTLRQNHTVANFSTAADLAVSVTADLSVALADLREKADFDVDSVIKRLGQGPVAWNVWRAQNPMATPNMTGADLRKHDFSNADFRGVKLTNANLENCKLVGANLAWSDLNGANFRGTLLSNANFTGATMHESDFTGSLLSNTTFAGNDLSRVKGLSSVQHGSSSYISADTLERSISPESAQFFIAAGIPEILIQAALATASPFKYYSCFISYSSKDEEFAQRLHADLQAKGVRCWFAPEDLRAGDRFRNTIDETIRVYDKLLLVISKYSVKSEWVEDEVETALEKERQQKRTMLFPIRLDDAVLNIPTGWPADIRRTRHIGDFHAWETNAQYQKAFARLLRDLQSSEPPPTENKPHD